MSEPLEELEEAGQDHGKDSRFHGLIAAFVADAPRAPPAPVA
jgi:hypothetical protein